MTHGGTAGAAQPAPGGRDNAPRVGRGVGLLRASTAVREHAPPRSQADIPAREPEAQLSGLRPEPRLRRALPYAVTATFLAVLYLRTLLPSVGYHMDTAKFGYLGQVLGTGHPPGEPLYLMLNAAWVRWLPLGTPALRANLLSAVFGVLACLVLMLVLRELGVSRWVAAAGAAAIGVSRLFWQQSIVAEVYSLSVLFAALTLWLCLGWLRTRRELLLVAALGIFGLSFSNHPMGLFLLPGLGAFLMGTRAYRVLARPRNLLALLGCALVTVATWGYIVWRSLDPATPYLELDIHSWSSFWSGITAQEFQGYMFDYGPLEFFTEQIPFALRQFWLQYLAFSAAGVWGFVALWRRRRQAAMLTGLWALAITVFAMSYQVSDAAVFYLMSWVMLGLWIAVGLQELIRRVARRVVGRGRLRWAVLAPVLVTAAAPLILAGVNYPRVDLSGNDAHQELSRAVAALPRKAIVFTPEFQQYQGLNYFLVPAGAGDKYHQYAELGAGYASPDADRTDIGRIVRYCRGAEPMRLEWLRETVPAGGDLGVFVYSESYAQQLAARGYPMAHEGGELYRMSCTRFGVLGT